MSSANNDTDRDTRLAELFQAYLDGLPEWKNESDRRTYSESVERETYTRMLSDIDGEEDTEIKQFMQDTLEHYCDERSMLLSYIYENCWQEWVEDRRALQKEIQPIGLYIALETILASQSDSSGYTQNLGGPRYPLIIPDNYSSERKVRNVDPDVSPAQFLNSSYRFGVHQLYVGRAIKNILNHLEECYDLNFVELERNRQREIKK